MSAPEVHLGTDFCGGRAANSFFWLIIDFFDNSTVKNDKNWIFPQNCAESKIFAQGPQRAQNSVKTDIFGTKISAKRSTFDTRIVK